MQVQAVERQTHAGSLIGKIRPAWFLVIPIVVLIGGLYLLPLVNVLLLSITEPELGFGNFERVLTSRGSVRVLTVTLRICAITTAVTISVGFCVAWAMAQVTGTQQRLLMLGIVIPLWISVLVRSLSWLVLLRENGLINDWLMALGLISQPLQMTGNELGVIIGMVHYLLPFAVLPMYSVMKGIDERLLFASRSLGAPPSTTFFRIYLPLALPGVFASAIIVFVFALGFYVTPAILGGGRVVMLAETVSVSILTTARWGLGAAQAVVLLMMTLILFGIVSKTVGLKKGLS